MEVAKDTCNPSYLEEQDQITRLCLTGSGIVCGLDICIDEDHGVHISKGNGITSNGKYIEVPEAKHFKYYIPFQSNTPSSYTLFKEAEEIWELVDTPDGEPLKPQSSEEEHIPFLRDKVLILFLVKDENEIQVDMPTFSTHFLLMNQSDVLKSLQISQLTTRILWQHTPDDDDFIFSDDFNTEDDRPQIHSLNWAINPAFRLPELYLQRLGFNSGDPFNCPPEGVDASVFPEIKSLNDLYKAYIPAIDEATSQLDKALNHYFEVFAPLLNCIEKTDIKKWISLLCLKWETFKKENDEGTSDTKFYVQYFYSWVRDLIQAYNELRQNTIDFVDACGNSAHLHPNHLMLGIGLRIDLARQPQPLRHIFKQPPIYNGNSDRLQQIRLYSWRVLMMIKNFYLPDYVLNPKVNPYRAFEEQNLMDFSQIKITPSCFYDQPLAVQSIPFYYPVTWGRFSVHHFWNYNRTKCSTTDQLLSYHASDLDDSYTFQKQVIRPLHYQLNNFPFFRLEGHIGKRIHDEFRGESSNMEVKLGVKSKLEYLKSKYNLAIHFIYVDITHPLTELYELEMESEGGALEMEKCHSFHPELLGMEHISGVKEGGTFVIVYESRVVNNDRESDEMIVMADIVIADFFIPYSKLNMPAFIVDATGDNRDRLSVSKDKTLENPSKEKKIDLKKIKGIGPKMEKSLNTLGIYTYEHLSKLSEREFANLEKNITGLKKDKLTDWITQAKDFLKKTGK